MLNCHCFLGSRGIDLNLYPLLGWPLMRAVLSDHAPWLGHDCQFAGWVCVLIRVEQGVPVQGRLSLCVWVSLSPLGLKERLYSRVCSADPLVVMDGPWQAEQAPSDNSIDNQKWNSARSDITRVGLALCFCKCMTSCMIV